MIADVELAGVVGDDHRAAGGKSQSVPPHPQAHPQRQAAQRGGTVSESGRQSPTPCSASPRRKKLEIPFFDYLGARPALQTDTSQTWQPPQSGPN
jgi:hypothetical protein